MVGLINHKDDVQYREHSESVAVEKYNALDNGTVLEVIGRLQYSNQRTNHFLQSLAFHICFRRTMSVISLIYHLFLWIDG